LGVDDDTCRHVTDSGNCEFTLVKSNFGHGAAMEQVAPYIWLPHAKTYHGGGTWYTLDLDYARIFRILLAAGFNGYVSIEMEGQEAAETAMPKSVAMLQDAWERAVES